MHATQPGETLLLGTLQTPRLRVTKAIPLVVSVDNGQAVLTWPEASHLFGHGPILSDAIHDFCLAVGELYDALHDGSPLGETMLGVRATLDDHIRSVNS